MKLSTAMDGNVNDFFNKLKREINDEASFEAKKEFVAQGLNGMNRGSIKKLWDKVQAMWNLVTDKEVAWTTKIIPLICLLYLVIPVDAVPDSIPVAGLLDDAAVLGFGVSQLGSTLQKYLK
jgi:uncharacterized membrane protein YkvA (DUF1232 family)